MIHPRVTTFTVAFALFIAAQTSAQERTYDLVIYGGNAAGAVAAVQGKRQGLSVVLIEPGKHIGGLTSGGLGWTDSGNKAVIGGISREFYQRLKKYYDSPKAWKHQKPESYSRYRPDDDSIWVFEPHVAEETLLKMLNEAKVPIEFETRLNRTSGVAMTKSIPPRIISITSEGGKTFHGKMFIDATYEGDLLAAANVTYTVGRESNEKYHETINGVQAAKNTHKHRFVVNVDPFRTKGAPSSGLLPGIEESLPPDGSADNRVQAYCFRMCMSNVAENRVPFPKPDGYIEQEYELLLRNFEAGDLRLPLKPDMLPNGKTDTNNNCAVSTDYIGANYEYPEASYEEREAIIAAHRRYQQGLMWTLANHPRTPKKIRDAMAKWGLAKDEFVDNGNWPHQIYVREARRMVSDYVMTEHDCRRTRKTPKSIGMGSYNMDSHNCSRYVTKDGFVQNEGDIQISPGGPYQISYDSIVPNKKEAANLLSPVCVSSSHIAYGSIRMEPVFMILGQSAATAAKLAIEKKTTVQAVSYDDLREQLLKDKQVLEYSGPYRTVHQGIDPAKLPGIVVDDIAAKKVGAWSPSSSVGGFIGAHYLHDSNEEVGKKSVAFTAKISKPAVYEIRLAYTANPNRATNVDVIFEGEGSQTINQQKAPPIDGRWISLGKFKLEAGESTVVISNTNANGHVIADAVQWLKVD